MSKSYFLLHQTLAAHTAIHRHGSSTGLHCNPDLEDEGVRQVNAYLLRRHSTNDRLVPGTVAATQNVGPMARKTDRDCHLATGWGAISVTSKFHFTLLLEKQIVHRSSMMASLIFS